MLAKLILYLILHQLNLLNHNEVPKATSAHFSCKTITCSGETAPNEESKITRPSEFVFMLNHAYLVDFGFECVLHLCLWQDYPNGFL